jgi:hypothetical protein
MTEIVKRLAAILDVARDGAANSEEIVRRLIEAMRELPEQPGPRYTAGEYSRRNHEAMVDDILQRS